MIDWADFSLGQLMEIYAVSNTAAFLFNRFRRDTNVITIARAYESHQLAAEIKTRLRSEKPSAEDVVKAYSCLVALSFFDRDIPKKELTHIDLSRLRWGYQILELMEETLAPNLFVYAPYQPAHIDSSTKYANASSTSIQRILLDDHVTQN